MELVNITYSGEGIQPIELNPLDKQLVTSNFINSQFGNTNDYMELFIYDQSGQLLDQDYDAFDYYPYLLNNPQNNTFSALTLDPERDLKNRGFTRGNLNAQYNFYTKLFNSQFGTFYWIKEISTSRTELKLASQVLPNSVIRDGFARYQTYISTKNYYPVFYLNFGNNQLVTANNVAYTEDEEGGYLLIKLYEALPVQFDLKNQLWIVDKVAESVSFDVSIQVEAESINQVNRLRGPNFNVQVNNKNGQTTPYYNYNNLLASPVSSSFQKLLSYYQDRSVSINVNYSSFANFTHFSSAVERVNNFVYKLQQIESYEAQEYSQSLVSGGSQNVSYASSSIGSARSAINNIIKNFDTYEYFLYFDSSSWSWPKSTTTQPYQLYSTTSPQATSFLGTINTVPSANTASLLWSASYYDTTNKDLLHNSIPQYLLDDPSNQPFITFMDMIGQHFDNIWIYYKDVSNRFNAVNNPDKGISLDLVSDALRGLGFNLYTNSNVSDNLYYTLFGINPDGSLLPPTGSEIITNYVTSSLTTLPAQTIQDELYKRLYHNLPYLLKTKGTERGVKALVATYGIPDGILTVREFGGNPDTTTDGIYDLNTSDYKVTIATGSNGNVTGSLTLSSSLLSPYTTIQYYNENNRLNSKTVEVGFSTADIINQNITASQGYFDIDQLIGRPSDQYSSSYQSLVSASNAYFATYTQPNSIWEYIRLLKFYNNTIFKTIKDFIPARSNISTGIIVKSHLYERNKYARNEPSANFENYSQSIDIVSITGSDGGAILESTSWNGFLLTQEGLSSYTSSKNIEKYTGELSGSQIVITDGQAFNQNELSSTQGTNSDFIEVSLGALYQNVSSSVRSQNLLDLDYSSNQLIPVNYTAVTYSISQSQVNNYETYTNPNNPYAQVQDYNYNIQRSTIPRYDGSKTISATYNTFTEGDKSYGKTAAIDKIKYQYAYLVDIFTGSFNLSKRANAHIKYIIDNDENVLDLTKLNKNIFFTQNIFKTSEIINVSLFNYNNISPDVQFLTNNTSMSIYEGGWRYSPVLFNINGANTLTYTLTNPTSSTTTTGGSSAQGLSPAAGASSFVTLGSVDITSTSTSDSSTATITNVLTFTLTRTGTLLTTHLGKDITVHFNYTGSIIDVNATVNGGAEINNMGVQQPGFITNQSTTPAQTVGGNITYQDEGSTVIPANINSVTFSTNFVVTFQSANATQYTSINLGNPGASPNGFINVGGNAIFTSATTTTSTTNYVTKLIDPTGSLYVTSDGDTIRFTATQSLYYGQFKHSASFNSMDNIVFPFTVDYGDMIKFSSSLGGFVEEEEYRVLNTYTQSLGSPAITYLFATLNRKINLACLDGFTSYPATASRYIVQRHIPDETNVILRYDPSNQLTQDGILFPQDIDDTVRENAGNVIKSLKQQNLLEVGQNTLIFE